VKEGDVETVSSILEEQDLKSKYYKDEVTLLHLAVSNPTEAVTEFLIERGADVDAIDKHLRTPLHLAANIGSSNSLVLIANGAKTNVRDNYGFSPLMLSLKQHYFSLSSQFILFGADINFKRE
jgi:ankyrin repeat protein